jgi:3-oxoacyl-[acyl-carrier-protein] synthase-1
MNPVHILSVGMVTAVGLDAPSSCAAMRARLDGFRETRFYAEDGQWMIGAPVPIPRNWVGQQRMAHLCAGAICEAFAHRPDARGQTPIILCLAEEERANKPVSDGSALLRTIGEIAEIEPHPHSRVISHGRPSGHVALDLARKLFASERVSHVMIAGADSYLTSASISYYIAASRILGPDQPNGFIPGEAAAAVLCSRHGPGGLRLRGLGLAREPAYIYNPDQLALRGTGMTSAYRAALDETGIAMNRLGYRIADLIGEQYWFKQTELASLKLVRGAHGFQDLWSPGESLGNIGAAVVPVMIGMAYMAVAKGYAGGNPVLIEASGDTGACGAAVFAGAA